MSSATTALSRVLVGEPMRSDRLEETLLPKRLALPVFCSDPLSSVAYATEQILLVLALGGLSLLYLTPWVAVGVVALLVIVVASYRQTCHAYPNGGGAYAVSRANLGEDASLTAASALLIDYVLTVAVSVVAGVAAITSAVPELAPHAVGLSLGFVAVLTVMNLRGVKESGRAFAIPTYGFVLSILLLLGRRLREGPVRGRDHRRERRLRARARRPRPAGLALVFLVLRAFASGCTALTGVEAVSNGVPSFAPPKSRNAATTLLIMGVLAITMFAGITGLAVAADVHMAEDPSTLIGLPSGQEQTTALSQIALATFGDGFLFYAVQGFTAAILILAANTAFNGFPVLASLLGRDNYLPHQLANRGDRLVFSNGIALLAAVAALLIVAFDASVARLIQLYILGVFLSFTLSQAGMVRHWADLIREAPADQRRALRRKQAVNGLGAVATGARLRGRAGDQVRRRRLDRGGRRPAPVRGDEGRLAPLPRPRGEAGANGGGRDAAGANPHRGAGLQPAGADPARAGLRRGQQPGDPARRHGRGGGAATTRCRREWSERGVPVPLVVIESPYRETVRPVLRYVRQLLRENPGDVVSVVIPEYVVEHWWQNLLHNQTALRLKGRLLFEPSVTVTSVPWVLR